MADRKIKEQLKRKLLSEKGVISVFSLLVLSGFLMMFLAIYNWTIYALTVQRLEDSLEFSLSSVLSYYDAAAARELGLFVLPGKEELNEVGKDYFWRNMNKNDGVDIELLEYELYYPEENRFSLTDNLEKQIMQQEAIDGWLGLGSALYEFLVANELPADDDPDPARDAAAARPAADDPAEESAKADLIDIIKDFLEAESQEDEDRVELWRLLSPLPQYGYGQERLEAAQAVDDDTDVLDLPDNVQKKARQFKEMLKNAITAGKNQILRSEYILQQMDYATAKPVRLRYFNKAEVEYIIWGKARSWDNIRQTAFNIFLFRLILHSSYEFAGSTVTPLSARLAEAVLQGAAKSKAEVEQLYGGGKVAAFPGQEKLKMSYKDHLRLFLLFQSPKLQLQRLQDLLQVNLAFWNGQEQPADLEGYYNGLQARAKIKLGLWPFGHINLVRQGTQGYDEPFGLVEPS